MADVVRLPVRRTFPTWACGHARRAGAYGTPRDLCPGCARQARRHARHWAALGLAIALTFLVGLFSCAAEGDAPCSAYIPQPGDKCRAPTVPGYYGATLVCFCKLPRLARGAK